MTTDLPGLFFYGFAVFIIGFGGVVALSGNLLHSAFALFFALFGIAGFYVLLGADFLAVVQIMVYAGGISVLLIFGTMLTAEISRPKKSNPSFQVFLAALSGAGVLATLLAILGKTSWPSLQATEAEPTVAPIGKMLLGEYILPFEVVSFLLLAAMIGALMLVIKGGGR